MLSLSLSHPLTLSGIFESNAICRYLATQGANGASPIYPAPSGAADVRRAQIDMWMDWCNSFDVPAQCCLYPILGYVQK